VALVRSAEPSGTWVSVDTNLPNRLAEELLRSGGVRGIGKNWEMRREVRRGGSRFDFLLRPPRGREMLVEVKSVSLVEDGLALFPDAPTSRGTRHVQELAEVARSGGRAAVLFIVQRDDARAVSPHRVIDPEFTRALIAARQAGVLVRAARYRLSAAGRATWAGSLPVLLRPRRAGA
jgi:sugar fermentation stimulation protein A